MCEVVQDITHLNTPCFIVNEDELVANIQGFKAELENNFYKGILGYSVKTNSLPYLLSIALNEGCYAEVVSSDEYWLARKIGFPINRIVYNGPMKSKDTFIEAVVGGAYVNIENFREIEWLNEVPFSENYKLGVRVNINFETINIASEFHSFSRFGFDFENGDLNKAIVQISEMGFSVTGIHAHRTSSTRSLEVYRHICEYVKQIITKLNLHVNYIDIGGGYFGNMPGKPTYYDYANTIRNALQIDAEKMTVIVEPGNGLIASPVDYLFSVMDCKQIKNAHVCSTNATRLDVDPFFHKSTYQYEILNDTTSRNYIDRQILTGATCLENDVLMELVDSKELKKGDLIQFKCVGAYTMALTPNFINYLPTIYKMKKGGFTVVRKKWTTDNIMENNVIVDNKTESILFTNVGRRGKLMKDFIESIGDEIQILASDNWSVAPALFTAHNYYLTPKIREDNYIDALIDICKKENVKAITSLIDPEIQLMAKHAERFKEIGVIPLCPSEKSAELCFDKYKMFKYLKSVGINTVLTFDNMSEFKTAYNNNEIEFPVFIKPRTGSGSVGATKINTLEELELAFKENQYDYIIQEFMACEDCDADVYIDALTHKLVAAFSKRKIETRIGGASKTISFKDEKLFDFIKLIVDKFEFSGAVDMDFFCKDGVYYLSEINPRFGGAYLHAYGAGVDFPKMIKNNIRGIENEACVGEYAEGVIMLMYDDVVITTIDELKDDYRNAK